MASLHPDLQRVLDDLDAIDRSVQELSSRVSDEQFFWQPNEGRSWSIAQCLDHLMVGNNIYADGMERAVEAARGRWPGGQPIRSNFFGRKFIASLEPPVTRRMSAPKKIIPPPSKSRPEILDAFFRAHERLRAIARASSEVDVNRAKFRNPFIGVVQMRVGTALRLLMAHDRRHLWQAQNVTKAPGFSTAR